MDFIYGKSYKKAILKYLVKWKHFPFEDSTWEPIKFLLNSSRGIKKFEEFQSRNFFNNIFYPDNPKITEANTINLALIEKVNIELVIYFMIKIFL